MFSGDSRFSKVLQASLKTTYRRLENGVLLLKLSVKTCSKPAIFLCYCKQKWQSRMMRTLYYTNFYSLSFLLQIDWFIFMFSGYAVQSFLSACILYSLCCSSFFHRASPPPSKGNETLAMMVSHTHTQTHTHTHTHTLKRVLLPRTPFSFNLF